MEEHTLKRNIVLAVVWLVGERLLGVTIHGPLVASRATTPQPGFHSYGFLNESGVASTVLFAVVFFGLRRRTRGVVE